MTRIDVSRREFLWTTATSAGLMFAAGLIPRQAVATPVVDQQPWARLAELGDGVWAVVSTPLASDDWTTGCNGGLIAGKDRVLAVEGFLRPDGAHWLAEHSRQLTGQWPTDILITHFHGDHANGIAGYHSSDNPRIWATRTTLDLIHKEDAQKETPPDDKRVALLANAEVIQEQQPTLLDLGHRTVALHPRHGHTPSDVTAEIDNPGIVFTGDLVWNGLFPNYRDTEASAFSQSIRALRRETETIYVSGHGALSSGDDVDTLMMLVDSVEQAAREAHQRGIPLEEAASRYRLPTSVDDWVLFNPKYFEVAFKAWYEELA